MKKRLTANLLTLSMVLSLLIIPSQMPVASAAYELDPPATHPYPDQGFDQEAFDEATANVEMDIIEEEDYHLSSSKQSTMGWIAPGTKKLYVDSSIDFEVGQGVAIASRDRMSNKFLPNGTSVETYTWMVDKIAAIGQENGQTVITLTHNDAPTAPTGCSADSKVEIRHDNYYAFKEINAHYASASIPHVSFQFPENGDYEINAVSVSDGALKGDITRDPDSTNIPGNNVAWELFTFENKASVHIDFRDSRIRLNNSFHRGYDSTQWKNSLVMPMLFLFIRGCNNVKIEKLTLDGGVGTSTCAPNLPAETQQSLLYLAGVNNLFIEDCDISYSSTDGIIITSRSQNITLRRVNSHNNARHGMTPHGLINMLVEDSEFSYNGYAGTYQQVYGWGIDMESDKSVLSNVVYYNLKLINNRGGAFGMMENTPVQGGNNNIIIDNCLMYLDSSRKNAQMIYMHGFKNDVMVKNCVIVNEDSNEEKSKSAFHFYNSDVSVNFSNNTILGYMPVDIWGTEVNFSDNFLLLEYKANMSNTHHWLRGNPTDSWLRFDGDYIYCSDYTYAQASQAQSGLFKEDILSNTYCIGGYDFKDVTIYNEYGDFALPAVYRDSDPLVSSYDNVRVFSGIKQNAKFDISDYPDFFTYDARQFSTMLLGTQLKVNDCANLTQTDKSATLSVYQSKKAEALSLLEQYGLTYTENNMQTGSALRPYEITSPEDFVKINQKPKLHYKLMNDIDFTGIDFQPMCGTYNDFTGVLDGNGFAVKNISIDRTAYAGDEYARRAGIFHYINGGTIKNLTIENPNIIGSSYTGALVAYPKGGLIENCHVIGTGGVSGVSDVGGLVGWADTSTLEIRDSGVSATVTASGSRSGGLVGRGGAKIENCYFSGTLNGASMAGGFIGYFERSGSSITDSRMTGAVNGKTEVGGLVGYYLSSNSAISRCYVSGDITSSSSYSQAFIGGLVGLLYTTGVAVTNCYTTSSISGVNYIGGLTGGYSGSNTAASFSNCYYAGTITATGSSNVRGLMGSTLAGIVFTSCYFDSQVAGVSAPTANARTTAQMSDRSTYTGWDFDNVWVMNPYVSNCPTLRLSDYDVNLSYPQSSLVTEAAANISVKVTGADAARPGLTLCLANDSQVIKSAPVVNGVANLAHTAAEAPSEAGDYYIYAVLGGKTVASLKLSYRSVSPYMWGNCIRKTQDNKIAVLFFEDMSAGSSWSVKLNGVAKTGTIQPDGRTVIINAPYSSLVTGDKIVIAGVKLPQLYPSYSFTFAATFSPPAADDHPDYSWEAEDTVLSSGEELEGELGTSYDQDWFKLTTESDLTLLLQTDAAHLRAEIFDSSLSPLSSNLSAGFSVAAGESYYVLVSYDTGYEFEAAEYALIVSA